MLLSDRDIRRLVAAGEIEIEPFDPARVQPASYDVRLGASIRTFDTDWPIDPRRRMWDMAAHSLCSGGYWLRPGEVVLGDTVEWFAFPADVSGRFEGRSSLGRLGLSTHITAGFFDAGFRGTATVEIKNEHRGLPWWKRALLRRKEKSILLYAGMPIGQMSFLTMSSPAERTYGSPELGSRYQGQRGPTPARVLTWGYP